jgi:hypothetical protein
VTGEEERLEAVLPLVKKYGAAVVAISNDETGISEDPDVRFRGGEADRIAPGPRHFYSDIVVDPLVMPIGALTGGPAGVPHHPPPARRAKGEQHLRRLQLQLRPAQPQRPQRPFLAAAHRRRHDPRRSSNPLHAK